MVCLETLEPRRIPRQHYLFLLGDPGDFVKQEKLLHHGNLTMLCYHNSAHAGLVVAENRSLTTNLSFRLAPEHPAAIPVGKEVEIVCDARGSYGRAVSSVDNVLLRPSEVVVMEIRK